MILAPELSEANKIWQAFIGKNTKMWGFSNSKLSLPDGGTSPLTPLHDWRGEDGT